MAEFLLINGVNLNLLGRREPALYGATSLPEIEQKLVAQAQAMGHRLSCFQSNHEGAIVDRIHQAYAEHCVGLIINPGAYTHTSIALRDALLGTALPFFEVHLSNIHARETFRHHSYLSDIARGVIVGLGPLGYELALQAADRLISGD